MKRRVNAVTTEWDDKTQDPMFCRMLEEIVLRSSQTDPAHSDWCANGQEVTVWVDASSLATGVAIECDGAIIENASWLRPVHTDKHINLAELDAMLRGINLALHWRASMIHLQTDSACMHQWISDTLSRKARVRIKVVAEMLIKR